MTVSDWLIILAVFLGPIVAVRLTRYLDNKKEIRARKLEIFKTLMATRAYKSSWSHVEALNRIDLEFDKSHSKERQVINAWKEYLDLLGNTQMPEDQWNIKCTDLRVELLHKMAQVLNYDFDKTHIKNSPYSPREHVETEKEQRALRKGAIEVLDGEKPITVTVTNSPPQ